MILQDVGKRYGDFVALNRINLEIETGKITAVLGESGAGKSTLLSAIAGLIPFEGTIDGAEGLRPRRRERCSYLFQSAKLLPHLTVEGNLKFVLGKEEWERIPAMLEKVGLRGKEKRRPAELSGGECRRVAIARAFLYPHDLLLMDEPFSSIDLSLKRTLVELVAALHAETGNTVVFVTHDVKEAAVLSHRAVVISKGNVIKNMTIDAPFPRDFIQTQPSETELTKALLLL